MGDDCSGRSRWRGRPATALALAWLAAWGAPAAHGVPLVEVRSIEWGEGGRLRVLSAGPAEGPPVLLLHGARYTGDTWQELGTFALLTENGYRAVALDLPGFGGSTRVVESEEQFLVIALQRLGLERPVVVAPSMSGRYAFPALARHPERFAGFVLVAPASIAEHREALAGASAPALVVWGEADTLVPLEEGRNLAERLPRGQLVVLPDAGHACYLDQPQAFHAALLSFLGSLELRGR